MVSLLAIVLAGNVSFSEALPASKYNSYQTTPDHLNLIILVKASKASNDPINMLEGNPKTKLQVIQDAIESVFATYSFPPNVSVGIMAYGHKLVRDFDKSCKADNFEEIISVQPFSRSFDLLPFMSISGIGDAPTTVALAEAAERFPKDSPNDLNAILLIADGTDSCGQNPDEEAKILAERQHISIYTIGLSTNNNTDAELSAIADQANGTYQQVPNFLSASQRATDELSGLIINDLDNLLSRISTPVTTLPPTSTGTIPSTTPISTTLEVTETLSPPTETVLLVPTSSSTPTNGQIPNFAILVISILGISIVSVFGFVMWRSQRLKNAIIGKIRPTRDTGKILTLNKEIETLQSQRDELKTHLEELQNTKSSGENKYAKTDQLPRIINGTPKVTFLDEKLSNFMQDVYKTYSSLGEGGYIQLELLRKHLSNKSFQNEFNDLLTRVRREYPSKVWIDKDSRGRTIVKINM